jgi:hypothetical protein
MMFSSVMGAKARNPPDIAPPVASRFVLNAKVMNSAMNAAN